MSKRYLKQQFSMEDMANEYEDEHYQAFAELVFNGLLSHIREIPFEQIIQNSFTGMAVDYQTLHAHALAWLYTVNRKFINGRVIYSFRFPNATHPELYQAFATRTHPLFQPVNQQRHRRFGWCQYTGQNLLSKIDRYLNIPRVAQGTHSHTTKLFIHQADERLDIEFDFPSLRERITITFEPGYPACD